MIGKSLKLTILLAGLPLALILVSQAIRLLPLAQFKPASIIMDVNDDLGQLDPVWQSLAQGGEEKYPFDAVINEVTALRLKYIRLDHLYDFYDVVEKDGSQLTFDWVRLDKVVNQILKTGAKPFFSLSYMPAAIANNNEITAEPVSWQDWQLVVQKTVEHFSGRNDRNLNDIIYEVWNEPDLFGDWSPEKYCLLYQFAATGAQLAQNTNDFQIGGPGTTAPYYNWTKSLLQCAAERSLRLDFYSWHRYSQNPEIFLKDINEVSTWIAGYSLPKYLSEWGSNPQNSAEHDEPADAAHFVVVAKQLAQQVDLALAFEIKDGPDPSGKQYWGRWGLLTHESTGPVEKKPRYQAVQLLSKMTGQRLKIAGENEFISGLASRQSGGQTVRLILANYDQKGRHFESVPVFISGLENGTYVSKNTWLGQTEEISLTIVRDGTYRQEFTFQPNSVLLLELLKTIN